MQIFISEFLTCGAIQEDMRKSLLDEGRAMLLALVEDVCRIPGIRPVTCWSSRLGRFPNRRKVIAAGGHVAKIENETHEQSQFLELASQSDITMVIAPETDGILLNRFDLTAQAKGNWVGADREVIRVCSDKLATCHALQVAGIPTIETIQATHQPNWTGRSILKPVDGAGTEETFLLKEPGDAAELPLSKPMASYVLQPWVNGQSCSVFAVVNNGDVHLFPIASQTILASHSRFQRIKYGGGEVPHNFVVGAQQVEAIVSKALSAMNVEQGHFGVDFLVTDDDRIVVTEINPRLTTSYVGYRQILQDNAAERILFPQRFSPAVEYENPIVEFDTTGVINITRDR